MSSLHGQLGREIDNWLNTIEQHAGELESQHPGDEWLRDSVFTVIPGAWEPDIIREQFEKSGGDTLWGLECWVEAAFEAGMDTPPSLDEDVEVVLVTIIDPQVDPDVIRLEAEINAVIAKLERLETAHDSTTPQNQNYIKSLITTTELEWGDLEERLANRVEYLGWVNG